MPKGFQKGNNLGGRKKDELTGVQEYLEYLATGAARSYYKYLEQLFGGKEIPKPVKEAMDRFEKNTEFVTPKLARQELTGKDGKDLIPNPILGGTTNTNQNEV